MITRREIEEKIASVGDYVKMDILSGYLKHPIDADTRKFVMVKLAGIYGDRGMHLEAGKLFKNAAELNTTFQGKINDFIKSGEFFIKSGDFDEADISFKKGLACANSEQKVQIKIAEKEFYKNHAKFLFDNDKRKNSMLAYEKLLNLDLNSQERREVQQELLSLYEKLGKIREYYILKKSV